jgi:hypothetical protein
MVCLGSTATDSVSSWELGSHFLRGKKKKRTGKFERGDEGDGTDGE